jgi:uncharacterized metal-binding protein
MQQASFIGTIKVIFYIVVIFYVLKFLVRLFLPVLVKKVVEKAGQNFQKQYTNQQQYTNQSNNSDVVVDASNAKKSRETKKVGEYVDYEEID